MCRLLEIVLFNSLLQRKALRALLLAMILIPGISLAEELPDDPVEKLCISLTTNIVNSMREDLKPYPHLGPIDELILFTPYINFAAEANFKYEKIVITKGMCHELFLMADAAAIVGIAFPNEKFKLEAYGKYLAEQSLKANKNVRKGKTVYVNVERFLDWAKVDTTSLTYDMGVAATKNAHALLNDSLAMVIGHELSHMIYRDASVKASNPKEVGVKVSTPGELEKKAQISRWKEARADKKGLSLANNSGLIVGSPSTFIPLFGLMNRTHTQLDNGKGDDDHPPIICRVSYLMTHTSFFKEMAQISMSPSDKKYLTDLLMMEARKRQLSVQSISDFEKLMLQFLETDSCVDYWEDPYKLISSAKASPDTYPLNRLVSNSPAATAFVTSAVLQGGSLRYETPLSAMAVDAAEINKVVCNEGLLATPREIHIGTHNLAIQCQRYDTGPKVKTIFDAISDGRTFFAKLAPKNSSEQQFILVYGIRMLYAGVPKMMKIYYLNLSDNKLGSMPGKEFFERTIGGMDMRIFTR